MTDELKPVKCGCGGEGQVLHPEFSHCLVVQCSRCGIRTPYMNTEAEAITAWNKAMGRKTGKWIDVDSATVNGRCSVSVYESRLYENDVYGEHYCPNCGARLEWE